MWKYANILSYINWMFLNCKSPNIKIIVLNINFEMNKSETDMDKYRTYQLLLNNILILTYPPRLHIDTLRRMDSPPKIAQ